MQNKSKNIALLVFTRTLTEEIKAKAILKKEGVNKHLYLQLFQKLEATAKQSGLNIIWWDSSKQKQEFFADNFYTAFQDTFEAGYDQVIAVGNDCPGLHVNDLKIAVEELKRNDYVIGPSCDGGVYLLGMNKKALDVRVFSRVRWQTTQMLDDFLAMQTEATFYFLNQKADIDTIEDLLAFTKQKAQYQLALHFSFLLANLSRKYYHVFNFYFYHVVNNYFQLRAPPFI